MLISSEIRLEGRQGSNSEITPAMPPFCVQKSSNIIFLETNR